jgi:RNA polymerase sporulation-specific sigma factor
MIKVSRPLKELAYKAYQCKEKLQETFGREPTISEISEELKVSVEELTMAMEAGSDIESLQKSIYQKDGQEIRLMDKLPGKDREEDRILDHMVLGSLLNSLDQKERQLIYLRYFANRTQTQVGKELGISQVQVSRMEKRILKQMREQI